MIIKASNRISTVKEYYFSVKLKEIAKLRNEGKKIINLGIGSPDRPPDPTVITEMKNQLDQDNLHGYQSYVGRPELRNAMAAWYAKHYGVEVDPFQEVLPLIGSKEGIMHIHMAFINPGDKVLIPNPGYPTYAASAKLAGADIVYYNLLDQNNWQPDFSELESLDWTDIRIMWVNYPHMPTGARMSSNTMERLVELARKNSFLICHDNPYSFILNDKPQSIFAYDPAKSVCLELNSLSKSHNLAGWRIGCLIGGADYLKEVIKFKSNMDSGMLAASQFAAIKALKLEADWFDDLNSEYKRRKKVAFKIFDALGCNYDAGGVGMFLWGKIPESKQSGYLYSDRILEATGVFITPGGIFGSNGDHYLRISLCSDVGVLEEALEKILISISNELN